MTRDYEANNQSNYDEEYKRACMELYLDIEKEYRREDSK